MAFNHTKPYRILCWSLFGLWFVTLNIVSSIPFPEVPATLSFKFSDKIAHFGIFGLGAFLLAAAWCASKRGLSVKRFVNVFLLLTLMGIADEIRQLFIPGRSGADLGDMTANTIGALAGTVFAWFIHVHFLKPRKLRR